MNMRKIIFYTLSAAAILAAIYLSGAMTGGVGA